jgi:hypothetical protein
MHRRDFLIGSAALAAYGQIQSAEALNSQQRLLLGMGRPAWALANSSIDLDFVNNRYWGGSLSSLLSVTRASNATDLLPSSASGYAYNTYGTNVLALSPNIGLLCYEARTNLFVSPTAPVTQTITLPATGSYALWVNGAGSAAIAAGTATITGAGTATNGTQVVINCTVVGTVVVTITGSLNTCQLEAGPSGSSFISGTRAVGQTFILSSLLILLQGKTGTSLIAAKIDGSSVSGTIRGLVGSGIAATFGMGGAGVSGTAGGSFLAFTANLCVAARGFNLNTNEKMIGSWKQSNYALSLSGAAVVTSALTNTLVSGSAYSIGSFGGAGFFNGVIQRATFWNSQLSNSLLPGLST